MLGMGASCKGVCRLSETIKIPNSHKYERGLKRCSWCEVWLNTDEVRCLCCKMILRTKSRNKKAYKPKSIEKNFGENSASLA